MRKMKGEEGDRKEKLLKNQEEKVGHGYEETDEKFREHKLTVFKQKYKHDGHIAECCKAATDSTTHLPPTPTLNTHPHSCFSQLTKSPNYKLVIKNMT
jgi:hypothetical protein